MHVKIPINIEPTVITCAISIKHTRKQRMKAERERRKKGGRKEGHEMVVGNNNESQRESKGERKRERGKGV